MCEVQAFGTIMLVKANSWKPENRQIISNTKNGGFAIFFPIGDIHYV